MSAFDRMILVIIVVVTYAGYRNAIGAHRHTHELACHVGAVDLCKFHEEAGNE